MAQSPESLRLNGRLTAYTAAALYGAAGLDGLLDAAAAGGPSFSPVPSLVALVLAMVLLVVGPRVPRWALLPFGAIGVALIAYSLAAGPPVGDSAVLFVLPVIWTVFFFGLPGAVAIVAFVGVALGVALLSLPASTSGGVARWIDVMVSVSVVAAVIEVLASRNELLLDRLGAEARTDKLTGLLNRRGFEERAAVEITRARRGGQSLAVISLDIDYFKRVNDEWGHETGDRVLARVGSVLADHSRDLDVVARIGGEEFAILLPGADEVDADAVAQRIRSALVTGDGSVVPSVRISAGVAAAPAPDAIAVLLHRADSALYAAKRSGRDRTVIFKSETGTPTLPHTRNPVSPGLSNRP